MSSQKRRKTQKVPLDFESFRNLAHEMVELLPPELFRGLSGGVRVMPGAVTEDDAFLMGEYVEDDLGRSILIHYGSFVEVLEGEPLETWKDELYKTLVHELRHHVEALAGVDDLSFEERQPGFED